MKILSVIFGLALSQQALASTMPLSLHEKYSHLKRLRLEIHPNGNKSFGEARLFMREGIHILYLKGDRFEMAYQHGVLVKDIFASGAMPKIASMIENAARNSFPKIPGVTNTVIERIYKSYTNSILNHASRETGVSVQEYLVEAHGLAAGSGYPVTDIIHAFLAPEILQIILGQQMKGQKYRLAPNGVNECTDFAVPPQKTSSGGYIIGRNTDYSLNGYFDKYPTVIYYHPTDGALPHLTVTSAGVHTAGVVGYNSSGLFLGVHTIPTWDTSSKGHPVFDVGQHVIRTAKSFDEAIAIFKSRLPGAGWAYTLVSTRENRTAAIELSNSKLSIRETSGEPHIQTNHFLSAEMANRNLDINAAINEDTRARLLRTQRLISQSGNEMDVPKAVSILADKTDPFSNIVKGLGNVISTHFTVTSAVIDSGTRTLFVANGGAPTSSTAFIQLPLIEEFNPDSFEEEPYNTIIDDRYHSEHPQQSLAEQMYIRAKHAYEIELDPKKSRELLHQTAAIDTQNPAYLYMLGLMEIKTGALDKAKNTLVRCGRLTKGHYNLACRYFAAKIDAANGRTRQAKDVFAEILLKADPKVEGALIRATRENLKKLKHRIKIRVNPDTLSIFMPEADVLAY